MSFCMHFSSCCCCPLSAASEDRLHLQDRSKCVGLAQDILDLIGDKLVQEFKMVNGKALDAAPPQVALLSVVSSHMVSLVKA